ncbi:FtsX-like permease family protein [Luteibacter aegosomaticola]|uniref:ABC transporter permease n=1 Tax=Luteibacter aegosomaticola TaxID=2911538 RepID=UPI001FF87457|nr:FtsX-like permease family protein [Luteibacter aegosomaticola]UPG88955.1 FtsX-like permease family protein [Luteibacter aegosomaticola]
MRLDIAPILAALRRHRITSTLLVLQIALTCAIVCNAVFLVTDRIRWMDTPSGIDEDRIAAIRMSTPGQGVDIHARAEADLAALRAVHGVEDVSTINSLPFGGRSWTSGVRLDLSEKVPVASMAMYYGERAPQLLGAQLQEGRWIRPDEYGWIDDIATKKVASSHVVMLTQPAATRLFPGKDAVGQMIYVGDDGYRVVGIVRRLANADLNRATIGEAIITPFRMLPTYGAGYVIRTAPGQAGTVLAAAAAALKKVDARRVVTEKTTYAEVRSDFFASDRALAAMLVGACVVLLAITALGIVGLASFWVAQRRRQIGVRRALGATRGDVLRYFQTENFLLASMGIALGMVLAYGMNVVLMVHYELPRLPWGYLPAGALSLWLLGQLAVLAPALRAAAVSPVEATRG